MAAYATLADLASYLAVDVTTLTGQDTRLLTRASDLLYAVTCGAWEVPTAATDTSDPAYAVLNQAACAQAEYWRLYGEALDTQPAVARTTIGKFSQEFTGGRAPRLAPRAYDCLLGAGLLYRGKRVR